MVCNAKNKLSDSSRMTNRSGLSDFDLHCGVTREWILPRPSQLLNKKPLMAPVYGQVAQSFARIACRF